MALSLSEYFDFWIRILKKPAEGVEDSVDIDVNIYEGATGILLAAVFSGLVSLAFIFGFYTGYDTIDLIFGLLFSILLTILIAVISSVIYYGLAKRLGGEVDIKWFIGSYTFVFGSFVMFSIILNLIINLSLVANLLGLVDDEIAGYVPILLGALFLGFVIYVVARVVRFMCKLNTTLSAMVSALPPLILVATVTLFLTWQPLSYFGTFGASPVWGADLAREPGPVAEAPPAVKEPDLCPQGQVESTSNVTVVLRGWRDYKGQRLCSGVASGGVLSKFVIVDFYYDPKDPTNVHILVNGTELPPDLISFNVKTTVI